jgi:hypothetical protein
LFFVFLGTVLCAQQELSDSVLTMIQSSSGAIENEKIIRLNVGNRVFSALLQNGDTIIVANLGNINVSSPKNFENHNDYLTYLKYRRYAGSVFPYAKEAIRIFDEAEIATQGIKKRKRKKHLKRLAKELKTKFEKPLKKLSKTQGKILVKMIEREVGRSMYDLIKNTNGWWKAMYWNKASKFYGYRLKEGYIYGNDRILDVVLMDFDISSDLSAK